MVPARLKDSLLEPWVAFTIAGAFLQNLRSFAQRYLTASLSVHGSSYVRFLYALPVAWMFSLSWLEGPLPELTAAFWLYVVVGATSQMFATSALIAAVSGSQFAVGTAMSKTESVQATFFGLLILSETISLLNFAGILISLLGAFLVTGVLGSKSIEKDNRAVPLGLVAGSLFALCSVCFRGATLELDSDSLVVLSPFSRAIVTLTVALTLQTILMGVFLVVTQPGQLGKVLASWRIASIVGIVGAVSSICWFTAMSLVNAALVRAMGQIELVFTVLTSLFIIRERVKLVEIVGMFVLVFGMFLLVD
jgi:drug/metabolite transporter (DMT)-like permease